MTMMLLLLHMTATWMMTGIIWFVQIVHYPLFDRVGVDQFQKYEHAHVRAITWVVAPPMLIEALLALALPWMMDGGGARLLAWSGLVLVGIIWVSTAFLQVPCHRRLKTGFDPAAVKRLVVTNWLRTAAWSLRAILAAILLVSGGT